MGGSRSEIRRNPQDLGGIHQDGEGRSQVPRDHDGAGSVPDHVVRLGKIEQAMEDPDEKVLQIVQPVQHQRIRRPHPERLELQDSPLEGAGRRQSVLPDVAERSVHEVGVVQHEELGLEDPGLHASEALGSPFPDRVQTVARPGSGLVKALHFPVHLLFGHRQMRDLGHTPADPPDGADGNSLRDGEPLVDAAHRYGSPLP